MNIWDFFVFVVSYFIKYVTNSNNEPGKANVTLPSFIIQPSPECSFYTHNTPVWNKTCPYGYNGKYCDECGLSFKKPNVKILGGVEAVSNSWPSIAFIMFNYTYKLGDQLENEIIICGGTIIDRKTILTAAHCYIKSFDAVGNGERKKIYPKIDELNPSINKIYSVHLGIHNNSNILNNESPSPGVKPEIEEFILHPNFNETAFINDIAIIKLKNEIKFNCNIQPACLEHKEIDLNKSNDVYAVGWGALDDPKNLPDSLHNVKLNLYNITVCKDTEPKLPEKQLCAGQIGSEIDTCQGDSGGPLYMKKEINGKSKYVVIGVVSYGLECGSAKPGVYSKVSSYLDWINRNRY